MMELGKSGKIAGGYRLTTEGASINNNKSVTLNPYLANGDMVSSLLIINAADMEEIKQIAAKCPVFELGGNVEIRVVQHTAN